MNGDTADRYSPSLTRHPGDARVLAITAQRRAEGASSCVVHLSGNGGATWRVLALPSPVVALRGNPVYACEPRRTTALTFDSTGRLWTAFLVERERVYVSSLPPGATSFSSPLYVGEAAGGRVYGAGAPSVAVAGERVVIAWSDRLGVSVSFGTLDGVFEPPSLVEPNGYDPALAARPDGTLLMAAVTPEAHDCGLHLERLRCNSSIVARIAAPNGELGSPAEVARAPGHRVTVSAAATRDSFVIAWDDAASAANALADNADYDVSVARSEDGSTWRSTLRVQARRGIVASRQILPALSAAANGRVDLAWYDARNEPVIPGYNPGEANVWDVYGSSSTDGGASWGPLRRLTRSSIVVDSPTGLGIASIGQGPHVVWESVRSSDRSLYFATASSVWRRSSAAAPGKQLASSKGPAAARQVTAGNGLAAAAPRSPADAGAARSSVRSSIGTVHPPQPSVLGRAVFDPRVRTAVRIAESVARERQARRDRPRAGGLEGLRLLLAALLIAVLVLTPLVRRTLRTNG